MPSGITQYTPRSTEEVARETIIGLFCQAMDGIKTGTPQGWEIAARAFDECADVCRVTEKAIVLRPEPATCPATLDIARLVASGRLNAGPHQVRAIVSEGGVQ